MTITCLFFLILAMWIFALSMICLFTVVSIVNKWHWLVVGVQYKMKLVSRLAFVLIAADVPSGEFVSPPVWARYQTVKSLQLHIPDFNLFACVTILFVQSFYKRGDWDSAIAAMMANRYTLEEELKAAVDRSKVSSKAELDLDDLRMEFGNDLVQCSTVDVLVRYVCTTMDARKTMANLPFVFSWWLKYRSMLGLKML